MARKDCEYCGKHRARWLVRVMDSRSKSVKVMKICGICKWKLWPSPRRTKELFVVEVVKRIRGSPLLRRRKPVQPT